MDPDLTIVLLGKTGVGKSAAGNTILGRTAFESDLSFTSVTTKISEETGRVFEKQISVVDTPGILDNTNTAENIKTYCQNLLQSSRQCLFLVVLSVGRFTQEDQRAVEKALEILGHRGLNKSYLLFTNGDKLKNKSLEDFIFADRDGKLPDAVLRFRGASHLFNNEDGGQEQVQDLLVKTGYLRDQQLLDPLAAQQETVQRRIVLLGRPGVGKTSSGNTILGSKRFKPARNFNSVSTECVSESASVDGRLLQVVDTPGFTDELLTPEQLYLEIMKSLVEASPGPHAFVVVVKIGNISEADKRLFELLPKLFGEHASKYTVVLFTHGDGLEDQSVDDLIKSNQYISDLVTTCNRRYCVFDNTQRAKRLQVRELLNTIDEMVEANGGEHYTSDMFRMAETFIREERNRAAQSADCNPSGTSAVRYRSGTSAARYPSGTSAARYPSGTSAARYRLGTSAARYRLGTSADGYASGQSGGTGSAPDERPWYKKAWERLRPYLIGFAVGGVIGLVGGAVAFGAACGVVGGVVGAAVCAVVGAGVGTGIHYAVRDSQSNRQSNRSSRESEDEQPLLPVTELQRRRRRSE